MALYKIDYMDRTGVWSCPDCGWESEKTNFLANPSPPSHLCPKHERLNPVFDSSDD